MKKQMGIKIVYKILLILFVSVSSSLTAIGQEKYLLFDSKKDSIVNLDKNDYYKIDNNLFDINRHQQVDTITYQQFDVLEFSTVKELFKKANLKSNKILKSGIKSGKIRIIETNNEIFKKIYVVEKISKCKYKRTRVWWIDY